MAGKAKIGATIVLDGEQKYKQALRDIKNAQTQLRSEMRLCTSEFKTNQNSLDALQKKHQILSKQVETSAQKVKVYEQALASSESKQTAAASDLEKAKKAYDDASKAMEDMAKSGEHTDEELQKQKEVVEKLKTELAVAEKNYSKASEQTNKYQTALNNANAELNDNNNELKKNDALMDEAEKSTDQTAKSIDKYGNEVKDATEQTSIFGDALKANLTGEAIVGAIKALASAMTEIASAAIETGMSFESSMSKVQALSGATGSDLEQLTEKAKEMGASTMYTASEAADAFSYMALAGWDTKQMLDGIEPVLSLAAAANMDLAQASDIVTDYLTAFGLTAQDAGKFADEMAYAMANSNTNVTQLGEAYKNCATAAASMNFSVEDVTAALMTMANAGVKGGEAGTTLRAIMVRLATNTKDCRDELEKYGVSITDENGNLLSLSEIITNVASAFEGLNDTESANLSKIIAGQNQYTGLQTVLLGVSEAAKAGGQSLTDYSDALANCDGAAKTMADTMQDNLKGKLTILQSALEGLQVSLYETFDDSAKEAVDEATDAVTRLNKAVQSGALNVSLKKMGKSFGELATSAISLGETALPPLIDALTWIMDNAAALSGGILGVVTAMKAMEIVEAVSAAWAAYTAVTADATVAQFALNAAMEANPIGIMIVALSGLAVASYAAAEAAKDHVAALSEVGETSKSVAQDEQILIDSAKETAEAYETQKAGFDVAAQSANDLANKLISLNQNSDGSAASIAKQKAIVEQLNSIYPELGLAIDEETGALSQNTSELAGNIDMMKQQAKTAAAQERLTEITKEQIELETQQIMAEEQLEEQKQAVADAQERVNDAWAAYQDALSEGPNAEAEYAKWEVATEQLHKEQDALDDLSGSTEEGAEQLELLSREEEILTDQIGATAEAEQGATQATDEYAAANQAAAESARQLKLEGEELEQFTQAVASSVDSATNAFEEFAEAETVSKDTLQSNLDSQIEGLTQWADDFEELASRGVDDGLLKTLAEMGPEAEGYIQGLLSMTDEELSGYSDKYAEAMSLKEEKVQEIVETYQNAGTEAYEAYYQGLQDAAAEHAEDDTVKNAGIGTDEQVAAGIEEGTETVVSAAETMTSTTQETIENSDMVQKAPEVGETVTKSIGDGIESQTDYATAKAESMAQAITSKIKSELSSDTFYKLGQDIASSIAKGIAGSSGQITSTLQQLAAQIKANMPKVDSSGNVSTGNSTQSISAQSLTVNSANTVSAQNINEDLSQMYMDAISRTESSMTQLVQAVNDGMSQLAESKQDTTVEVVLEGDAQGVFNVVRQQSRIYKTSTGRSAFS